MADWLLDPAEGWHQRIKDELAAADLRRPKVEPALEHGATIEELLGQKVADAILNVVVP